MSYLAAILSYLAARSCLCHQEPNSVRLDIDGKEKNLQLTLHPSQGQQNVLFASDYPLHCIHQICPEMKFNEMHAPYDKHHKVSSFLKSHQNTYNSVKYEVI